MKQAGVELFAYRKKQLFVEDYSFLVSMRAQMIKL